MDRNNKTIQLAKKAADAWRNTDTYRQAAQIIDMLISALEGDITLTPPNEPLTIEQLRGMVGQWVWVVVKYEHCTCDGWALVTTPAFLSYLDQTLPIDFYGRKFTAYRRPPEGEEDT
ncbi:hypothetical protein AAAT68_16970 [Lawsonibacter asaccharolyticus]|jgi:hypothetical protein|nr:MAG TPA: hypothetical protein [Caudoviricetes sp.]